MTTKSFHSIDEKLKPNRTRTPTFRELEPNTNPKL